MNARKGFTLLELMITVGLVAIIAALAIPSYSSYVRRGRRLDAINTLASISLAEERYRTLNAAYGTLGQVWTGASTPDGWYTLSVSNNTATAYTITATAVGSQANDATNGTSCTPLTFTMSAGVLTKAPAACWPT